MKTKPSSITLFILLLALIASIHSSIPTIALENNVLNANSNYIMSYYNFRPFQATSFFQIDFNQSDIAVTDGPLNVTATLNNTAVNQSLVQANCTSKVCIIRLGRSFAENTNIVISFGQFRNPRFTAAQRISVFFYFGVNTNETQSISISASAYLPMPVRVNSITQSDFGVGSQDVTYTMNISFSYIPRDPQISIQIPEEVGYIYLDTELSFYGTIQNVYPFSTINMLIFSLRSDEMVNPQGFMLLTLKGFRNPRFIGTSSSFNVSMVQRRTATTSNCASCRVAYLYANSSRLLTVSSTTSGDITMNIFNPSSSVVSERISLTIGIKIVAPIPAGGKFRIILPRSIIPVMPIVCEAVYGFTVQNPAYCVYNQTENTIETVNFTIPYLEQTGDAIIKISVINPKDDRQTQFNFETLDEQNRKIGRSREAFLYKATPRNLNTTFSKNTTFLESSYTLSSSLVLSQTLSPSEDSVLVTLPPSQFYNLSAIQCTASSLTIPCTKTIQNLTNNLLIKFAPPCSVCNISSSVSFRINNLINPSFINSDTKAIGIQTVTNFGVIETFTGSIDLKEKDLLINDLKWDGSQQVGSDFKLLLNYELPKYVQKYGGFLVLNFNENSSFVNVAVSGASYTYPQTLGIINENNQSLSNTITYWQSSRIKSLKQIRIKMCTSDSACGSIITISSLRKFFYPLGSANMSFKAQTLNGDAISTSLRDITAFMPQPITSSLSVVSTIPTTNMISNYVFKVKLNKLPFDSGLRIDLTSRHEIQTNGRCFVEVSPSAVLGFGIDCVVVNPTSILLTYSGDLTFMTASQIDYTLTIVNVLNPPSLMPITYKIQTSFNSIKTGTYSISYALSQPYTLVSDQLATSNSTYGQNATLSIRMRPGYYAFDELKLYIPKENFRSFSTFNGLSSTNGSYKMTENSTFFILDKIFTLPSTFTIELSNALNTGASGKILAQMYVQGYLSSRGQFDMPKITPVYLYATASSSNRFVGENTTLTFDVRRVNSFAQQKSIKINFNNTVLTMPPSNSLFTADQSSPQIYTYTQQLSTWTNNIKSIVLQSFQNMKFIPKFQTLQTLPTINVSTFDQNNMIVATTSINLTDIISSRTKDSISYTFTRINPESLNNTDIIVEFAPRYPDMAKLVRIQLPSNENRLQTNSSCVIGDTASNTSCQVVDKLFNTLTIQYPTTSTKVTLKNILNQFPSENNLTLVLMTQESQLIEQSSKPILPPIDFDELQMTGSANTSAVGSPVQLQLTIKSPQNYIEVGSKVKFTLPDKIYSRQGYFMTKDCEYEISGVRYSGCQYEIDTVNDNREWIQTITVSNFGQSILMPSTTVKLILYLMNPWTAYSFGQKNITAVQLNSMNQQVARGSILLNSIYPNVTAFNPATLQAFSFIEMNRQCDGENVLNLTITLPVTIPTQTYLYLILPSVYFSLVAGQVGFEVQSQNASFIRVRRLISECPAFSASSGVCARGNETMTFMVRVKNQKYFRTIDPKPKMSVFFMSDNSSVTTQVDISLNDRIANSLPDMSFIRSNADISENTINTLKYTLPSSFNISIPLKVSITPTVSPIGLMKSIGSFKYVSPGVSSSPTLTSNLNDKQLILSSSFVPSTSVQIELKGLNPSFAPNVDNETYTVNIYDESYVYFSSTFNLTQQNRLKPIFSGIQIKRSNSLVNTLATYTITGSLPQGVDYGRLIFNTTTNISAASSTDFKNLRIGDFINPLSSNWDTYDSLSILNQTHIIFMNNRIKTTPDLTSLTLPANTITSVQYNKNMRINTEEALTINFGNSVSNTAKINLKIPTIFKSIKSVKVNSQPITSYKLTALNSSHSWIEIPVTASPSKIELTFTTLEEQKIFANASFVLETEFPTQSYQQMFNLNIYGTNLNTTVKMSSTKVNEENKIEVGITPLNKVNTKMFVYFPTFMNAQLKNLQSDQAQSVIKLVQNSAKKTFNLQFSSSLNAYFFEYALDQSALSSPFTLTLDTVTNPSSNQSFYFIVEQQQLSQNKPIIGHSSIEIKTTTLELIYVKSAQRNTSKIGVPVEIQAQIQVPSTLKQSLLNTLASEKCVIQMPAVQVVRLSQDSECQVYLQGQNSADVKLSCQMHPTLNNSIITSCKPGLNRYSIRKGFKNMLYSIIPNNTQKPYVYIGEPYFMAQSEVTSTSFLSPIVTSGSLSLNKLASSSSVRLENTVLTLDMVLENIQEVNCVNFKFEKENYIYLNNDLRCMSNGKAAECWSSEAGSIMVNITEISSNNLHIEIGGLMNYLRQGNFTIRTLKYLYDSVSTATQGSSNAQGVPKASSPISISIAPESAFGLIDIFYSSLNDIGAGFVSNTYKTRVINPENYVSSEVKRIEVIFDDEARLPTALDKTLLNFNITTNVPDCQLTNSQFSVSKILTCNFTQSMNFALSVKLFHEQYTEIELSSTQYSSYIYPTPSANCQNQMCDLCSNGPSGQEKCFSCRQNYFEFQNGCIEACPTGYTSYTQYMTCEQCSSDCQSCFGLYDSNCLQCQNNTLVSQNGICVEQCSSGYPQNGYCIGDNECFDQGCRLCSATGFCYQCLPDYSGQPTCQWEQLLPSLFMSFFAAPFAVYALVSTGIILFLKGAVSMTYQIIFSFSLLEFMSWIFIVPALHTKQQAMLLISLVILRIVLGIVAYETYYKKQINSHIGINEQESLLEKEKSSQKENESNRNSDGPVHFDEDWKSRIIRFLAHTNGIDSYEAFKVFFSTQLRFQHNNLYLWISTGNRILVCAFMFYILSQAARGDLIILPVATILSSLAVVSLRAVKSKKLQELWQKVRGSGK